MHHMNGDLAYGKKDCRQLHKNTTSYTEQISEATSHKTANIRPPITHLENHPNETNKTCSTQLEKKGRTHKRCTSVEPIIWTSKCWLTIKNLSTTTLYILEDLPEAIDDRDEWQERAR